MACILALTVDADNLLIRLVPLNNFLIALSLLKNLPVVFTPVNVLDFWRTPALSEKFFFEKFFELSLVQEKLGDSCVA